MPARNVLVTGGSRGIGLAVAQKLSHAGYRVIALARKNSAALAAMPAIHFVPFDLGETGAIADLVRRLKSEFGPLYGLVNNAALGTEGLLSNMHNSRIEELLRVNVLAPVILSKYALRGMMNAGGGRIVNVASILWENGASGVSVYAATKASLVGFTRSLSREAGRFNITVNAVSPGFIDTEMTGSMTAAQREKIARRSALKRLASVEDVAAAVEFLMGEGARNITGTVLTVDAGTTA